MSRRNRRRRGLLARGVAAQRPAWLAAWPWRQIGAITAGVAIAGAVLAVLGWLLDQPIQRVIVTGRLQRVSALDVEKVVRARLGGAGLLTVDLAGIDAGLRALPWVDRAAVQRSWPRGLKVEIFEQSAVARWNDAGLVNARGELFVSDARFVPPELAQLIGPVGSNAEVTARYLSMQGRLTEAGLRLVSLTLDARGAWSFLLDDGVAVRLGRRDIDARFERFVLAAARLVTQRAADIAYVDMRYGNGFAVGWKGNAGHLATTGKTAHFNG